MGFWTPLSVFKAQPRRSRGFFFAACSFGRGETKQTKVSLSNTSQSETLNSVFFVCFAAFAKRLDVSAENCISISRAERSRARKSFFNFGDFGPEPTSKVLAVIKRFVCVAQHGWRAKLIYDKKCKYDEKSLAPERATRVNAELWNLFSGSLGDEEDEKFLRNSPRLVSVS